MSRDAAAWRFREAPVPPAPVSPDPVADNLRRKPVALIRTADGRGGHAAGMPRAVEAVEVGRVIRQRPARAWVGASAAPTNLWTAVRRAATGAPPLRRGDAGGPRLLPPIAHEHERRPEVWMGIGCLGIPLQRWQRPPQAYRCAPATPRARAAWRRRAALGRPTAAVAPAAAPPPSRAPAGYPAGGKRSASPLCVLASSTGHSVATTALAPCRWASTANPSTSFPSASVPRSPCCRPTGSTAPPPEHVGHVLTWARESRLPSPRSRNDAGLVPGLQPEMAGDVDHRIPRRKAASISGPVNASSSLMVPGSTPLGRALRGVPDDSLEFPHHPRQRRKRRMRLGDPQAEDEDEKAMRSFLVR